MPSTFAFDGGQFNFRVAGVVLRGDQILMHQSVGDDYWTLPGGRPELGEPTPIALRRELGEELHVIADVTRLLWIVETFFEHQDRKWHEVALYYLCRLPADSSPMTAKAPFIGMENNMRLIFDWFSPEALRHARVYPLFLREGLANLPATTTHIIDVERI